MRWSIESGEKIGYWVAGKIDGSYFAEKSQALGLVRDGEIIAGVIFENFNGRSLVAHMAATGRLTPAYLGAIFDYAFNVCGVEKAICPVAETNTRSVGLVVNMGFAEEARIKDASPQGDVLIYTLTKQNCRFLGDRYGKKLTTSAPRA